eukprot:1011277-Amphidinium_carterae.1
MPASKPSRKSTPSACVILSKGTSCTRSPASPCRLSSSTKPSSSGGSQLLARSCHAATRLFHCFVACGSAAAAANVNDNTGAGGG